MKTRNIIADINVRQLILKGEVHPSVINSLFTGFAYNEDYRNIVVLVSTLGTHTLVDSYTPMMPRDPSLVGKFLIRISGRIDKSLYKNYSKKEYREKLIASFEYLKDAKLYDGCIIADFGRYWEVKISFPVE